MTTVGPWEAEALRQRLLVGWSVIDEHGNEIPVRAKYDRKGRDLRRGPRDFAKVPTVDALIEHFNRRPIAVPEIGAQDA